LPSHRHRYEPSPRPSSPSSGSGSRLQEREQVTGTVLVGTKRPRAGLESGVQRSHGPRLTSPRHATPGSAASASRPDRGAITHSSGGRLRLATRQDRLNSKQPLS
jgi:hypothetical protein